MLELLLLLGFAGVAGTALRLIWTKGLTSRKFNVNPELPAPEPRRMIMGPAQPLALTAGPSKIPASVQAEIDETPEWWDKKFHEAMVASGAQVVEIEDDEITVHSCDGSAAVVYRQTFVEGCSCRRCGHLTSGFRSDRL